MIALHTLAIDKVELHYTQKTSEIEHKTTIIPSGEFQLSISLNLFTVLHHSITVQTSRYIQRRFYKSVDIS